MSQPVSAWQRFLEDLQLDEKGRAALREWGRSLLMNDFLLKQAEMVAAQAAEAKEPLAKRRLTAKASFLRAKAEYYKSSSSRQSEMKQPNDTGRLYISAQIFPGDEIAGECRACLGIDVQAPRPTPGRV